MCLTKGSRRNNFKTKTYILINNCLPNFQNDMCTIAKNIDKLYKFDFLNLYMKKIAYLPWWRPIPQVHIWIILSTIHNNLTSYPTLLFKRSYISSLGRVRNFSIYLPVLSSDDRDITVYNIRCQISQNIYFLGLNLTLLITPLSWPNHASIWSTE